MLARGVLTLILGIVVLVWPQPSTVVASVLFGVFLVGSGIAEVVFAFTLEVSADSRVALFISGVLSLVLGVLAFRHFGEGFAVLLLAIWIGVALLFEGVGAALAAIDEPVRPGRALDIFLGIVTAVAGVVVLAWPFHTITALTIVAGISLVLIGISEIVSAYHARPSTSGPNRTSATGT
jgi:uncharacterized membrane protein HdeD (DUF308 family)